MKSDEKIYNIIYGEVWKTYRRTVGDMATQKCLEDISNTAHLITSKLRGANLINDTLDIGSLTKRIEAINDKIKKKRNT